VQQQQTNNIFSSIVLHFYIILNTSKHTSKHDINNITGNMSQPLSASMNISTWRWLTHSLHGAESFM